MSRVLYHHPSVSAVGDAVTDHCLLTLSGRANGAPSDRLAKLALLVENLLTIEELPMVGLRLCKERSSIRAACRLMQKINAEANEFNIRAD